MTTTAAPATVVPAQAGAPAVESGTAPVAVRAARTGRSEPLLGFLLVHAVLPALLLLVLATLPVVITLALQGDL